jgi:hypothetical protein
MVRTDPKHVKATMRRTVYVHVAPQTYDRPKVQRFVVRNTSDTMLGGSPCHHGMARPRVADGRDGLQLEVSCKYIE